MVRTRILAAVCAALLSACSPGKREAADIADANAAKVALGKRIFFDTSLSSDGRTSCATCHKPELAFTDGLPRSKGVLGREGTRNAPSLIGVAERRHLFWDGRETDLSRAALQPFTNSLEMGLKDGAALLERLQADVEYPPLFARAYGRPPAQGTINLVGDSLAAYLAELPESRSAYSRYRSGDASALDNAELAGLELFRGKAQCAACHHLDDNLTLADGRFHHLGTADRSIAGRVAEAISRLDSIVDLNQALLGEPDIAGLGRFAITRRPADIAAFRTPSLQDIARTAPYMHDGSITTLKEAIDQEIYYRALSGNRSQSLTMQEQENLAAFLASLSTQ